MVDPEQAGEQLEEDVDGAETEEDEFIGDPEQDEEEQIDLLDPEELLVRRSVGSAGTSENMRGWNPRELLPALDSAAAHLLFRPDRSSPVLPGLWTPLTALSKAAAVKALFPNMAEQLYTPPTPPPPPPPPMSIVFFSGDKREEVLDLAANFPDEVMRFGFFTKSRKLLAAERSDYEKLVRGGMQAIKTLLVLEVARKRSAPLLELTTAGPQYISANPAIAKNDVDEFFGSQRTAATPEDIREITKVPAVEVIEEEVRTGLQRSSAVTAGQSGVEPGAVVPLTEGDTSQGGTGLQPPAALEGDVVGDPPITAEQVPGQPSLAAGEGSVAEVDGLQGIGVLDVGEGDAPVTGVEGDTQLTHEEY